MNLQRDTLLCRYYYDPQDRIAGCSPLNQDSVQRFYRKDRLTTEIQGQGRHSVFEHEAQILAQQLRHAGKVECALLATDLQRSVLHLVSADHHQQPVYSPYGHRFPEGGLISLLGFNGQRRDPVTGHYLLGNGYRAFNPVLMRFNSPDSLSPFGKGGVNAYAYCAGDPVNMVDPMGEFGILANAINQLVSAPVATVQRVVKGLSTFQNDVMKSFTKAPSPVRPGHGPLTPMESGREGITKITPQFIDEVNLHIIGEKFTMVRKADGPPPIARFAKSKGYSEQELFAEDGFKNDPEVRRQYFHSQQPEAIERLRQADVNLLVATGIHVKKYPTYAQATRDLVSKIRSQ
ncbi:RHS repeat-associated core domain-containing protein [Pseudomonas sp. NFX224]|uniref:RHS repeat-associated core domain-containing protein n=1 Tax=Pseudomonas sp. NFX224 TaxID=3402862 RepID=UPI003AFA530E